MAKIVFMLVYLLAFYPVLGSLANASTEGKMVNPSSSHQRVEVSKDDGLGIKDTMTKVQEAYGNIPLYFIQNNGQIDGRVIFYERGGGKSTYLTKDGIYISLLSAEKETIEGMRTGVVNAYGTGQMPNLSLQTVRLSFLNSNKDPELIPLYKQDGVVNYLTGNDKEKWKTNTPTYSSILYKNIYEGIDARFYGNNREIEYDLIVKSGADPSMILISLEGIKGVRLDEDGDIEITLQHATLHQKRPYIYQVVDGRKKEIEGGFKITGKDTYAFAISNYDPSKDLYIDPVLSYSAYLGGSSDDNGYSIYVDSSGNAYVTGVTYSTDFPTTPGAYNIIYNEGYVDAFITKLNPSGTDLVYSTYLGGNSTDIGSSIYVDSSGNAYVTGLTDSTNFPTTAGAYDTTCGTDGVCNGGYRDAFITKLNPSGTDLVYSTYLGGSWGDQGSSIYVDSSGNAYVTGTTLSSDFSTTAGAYDTTCGTDGVCNGGYRDAFITKLNPSGTDLVYSTYLGGSWGDQGSSIYVDSSGNAYVTGVTTFPTVFPTTAGAYQTIKGGSYDAFITKMNPSGIDLLYSVYLGGSAWDWPYSMYVDSSGNAYVTGVTYSTNFPTTAGAYDTTCGTDGVCNGGLGDAFVIKFSFASSYTLTVSKSGTGSGTVTGNPVGINCGTDYCSEAYTIGTVVTLTAAPDSGSIFAGWSGSCSGTGTCTATMDANKSVTATFDLQTLPSTPSQSQGQGCPSPDLVDTPKG